MTERGKSGSISLRMDQFFTSTTDCKESENESQRLTGCVLWPSVCIRSSGQWSLFRGQHPSLDGPVFLNGHVMTSPWWWTQITWNRTSRYADEQVSPNGRPRGVFFFLLEKKCLVICIKWKLVHSSGPQFSSVSSTCDLAEIRDQTLKKSNELQIREWEQVPLNKRDHDLQLRIGNVEQVECLDLQAWYGKISCLHLCNRTAKR